MCSFLITNIIDILSKIHYINHYMKFRGPDLTNYQIIHNILFLHNLLHITGDFTKQPFITANKEIVSIYNGEIYNYKSFGNYKSDGECINDLYLKHGFSFLKLLDGEFAICIFDFRKNLLCISSDIFATKPLWYAFENNKFGISTYKSALERLDFNNISKLEANKYKIFNTDNFNLIYEESIFTFKLQQYKNIYDDWLKAFENSIKKRCKDMIYPITVCLSSGYDSGAICCALNNLKIPYKTYTILGNENEDIINKRVEINNVEHEFINISVNEFRDKFDYIRNNCEKYICNKFPPTSKYSSMNGKDIHYDKACIGISVILEMMKKKKERIYITGSGADEIISDYGFDGKKYYSQSCFGGLFPDDLEIIFPKSSKSCHCEKEYPVWFNFYEGTQESYIAKEDVISGLSGIEGRYPYLDKYVVQEFLYLLPELKNKHYKSVIHHYLTVNNYPFIEGEKIGFEPDKNLTPEYELSENDKKYLKRYSDVSKNSKWRNYPYLHYLKFGIKENRIYDTKKIKETHENNNKYLSDYPDIKKTKWAKKPYDHYNKYGIYEGRKYGI